MLVPETAAGQTERIMKAVRSREQMPMRHRLYEEEPWHSQGLRVLPVDNYLGEYHDLVVVTQPWFYYHFTTTACRNLLHFALFRENCDRVNAVTVRKQVG